MKETMCKKNLCKKYYTTEILNISIDIMHNTFWIKI
jgi:hypothetical protein